MFWLPLEAVLWTAAGTTPRADGPRRSISVASGCCRDQLVSLWVDCHIHGRWSVARGSRGLGARLCVARANLSANTQAERKVPTFHLNTSKRISRSAKMLVAFSLGLPPARRQPTLALHRRRRRRAVGASSRPRRCSAEHQHLLHATKLQHDTQTLAAELAAKERELERELHDDEAENARAAAQLADAKLSLKGQLRDLEAQAERGRRREAACARRRGRPGGGRPQRAPRRRREPRAAAGGARRHSARAARLDRGLERTVAAEAPRAHPAAEAPRRSRPRRRGPASPRWPTSSALGRHRVGRRDVALLPRLAPVRVCERTCFRLAEWGWRV